MKKIINLAVIAFLPALSKAQDVQRLRVNAAEGNAFQKGFLHEKFVDGKVFSKDGSHGNAKFNFNFLTNEMLFISPKGDTLKLAHPETTSMVLLETDTFCYSNNTFVKKVSHFGTSSLNVYQRQDMHHVDDESKDAYGYSSINSNSSVDVYSGRDGVTKGLDLDKNMVFMRNNDFLMSKDGVTFYPAKEPSFYKLYPKQKRLIKTFIETNKTNFKKIDDLNNLIVYIGQIQTAEPTPEVAK